MSSAPPPSAKAQASAPAQAQGPAQGWYPDPQGGGLRWWDGTAWTEHVQQRTAGGAKSAGVPATAAGPKPSGPAKSGESFSLSRWVEENQVQAALVAILVIAAVGAVAYFVA